VAHERSLEIARLRAEHTVDPGEALARLAPVCARVRARRPVEWSRCLCHGRLAELHEQTGDERAAQAATEESLRCLDEAGAAEQPGLPTLQRAKTAGHAAVLRGAHEQALSQLEQAERGLRTHRELPWVALELADVALLRARSLRALGRGAEAIEPLRAAIATYEQEIARSEDRAPRERHERATRLLAALTARVEGELDEPPPERPRVTEAQRRSSISKASSQR